MTRLLLIFVLLTQMGCTAIFWQTAVGTLTGNIGSELISELTKDELKEKDTDDGNKKE